MKTRSTILRTFGIAAVAAGIAACGGGGSDPNSPEFQAYEQRDQIMGQLGEAILVLNEMSNEERPVDEAEFLAAARSIAEVSGDVIPAFEAELTVPESRSTPEIWQNWDDFVASNQSLEDAAAALVEATESGGFEAGRGLVRSVRDTCGGCHRPYRAPEPD